MAAPVRFVLSRFAARHVASTLFGRVFLLAALVACRSSPGATPPDAGTPAASATPPASTRTALPLPPEPPAPVASLASEAPKLEAQLTANAVYMGVWSGPRADLDRFLTYVSDLLATSGAAADLARQVKAKGLQQAAINLYMVFTRTNAFTSDFTTRLKAHLTATKGEPHLGVWSPFVESSPPHDYSALAAWLNREDADYLREHIAAMRKRPHWGMPQGTKPDRPWLVYESVAVRRLALLGSVSANDCGKFFDYVQNVDPTGATKGACTPRYQVVEDQDLAPKSGHRILIDAADPDLTDEECATIVGRFHGKAAPDGLVAVRIPLHNDRPDIHGKSIGADEQAHSFPLCVDKFDGKGVVPGNAREVQLAFDYPDPAK